MSASSTFLRVSWPLRVQNSAVVLSAFRTQETNALLARTTFGVAENSQHLYGRALDVRFPSRLADAMVAARAMRRGGVGWYPHSGFIHLDTGPVRNWDLDNDGLQDLLIAPRGTPPAPIGTGEMGQWSRYPDRRRPQAARHIARQGVGVVAPTRWSIPSIGEGADGDAVTVAHRPVGFARRNIVTPC